VEMQRTALIMGVMEGCSYKLCPTRFQLS
jgi:hypothetical protein